MLARPGDVIDRSEPYRETITDAARASEITREVDRIMEGRDVRTPVADAVTDDFRARYPDMPTHLARGLGATYAAVVEIRDTEVINQVPRDNELRDGLGSDTRDEVLTARGETAPQSDPTDRVADEIARVLDHERAGELSAPFETAAEREAFRTEIARVLDVRQLDRLTSGDADALDRVLEDRLDRLYIAKVYLQSDAATANTEALRKVVDELELSLALGLAVVVALVDERGGGDDETVRLEVAEPFLVGFDGAILRTGGHRDFGTWGSECPFVGISGHCDQLG